MLPIFELYSKIRFYEQKNKIINIKFKFWNATYQSLATK